jgi:hypothetical protein
MLLEAMNIFQKVFRILFFVFSGQNIVENRLLLVWNRLVWFFFMTRDRWNLGNTCNMSPVIFFKAYKKIKKIKPTHVGCSLPVLLGLFSGGSGTLNLPNMRGLAFFAFFFYPLQLYFFVLFFPLKFHHLIFGWLLIEQCNLFWFFFQLLWYFVSFFCL